HSERFLSGTQMTLSSGSEAVTFTTFAEVQQISLSAFTMAVVFTYATTGTPGYTDFISLKVNSWGNTKDGCVSYPGNVFQTFLAELTSIMSAIGQPASDSGKRTVLSGDRMDALSAIK